MTDFIELNYIVWAFAIGISLAAVYMFYIRKVQGDLVRKLISIDACSPETAISLDKIHYKMNAFVKSELGKKTSLSETVKVTESGLYYINPEMLEKAKSKYKNDVITVVLLVIFLFLIAGIGLLATYALPELIKKTTEVVNSR